MHPLAGLRNAPVHSGGKNTQGISDAAERVHISPVFENSRKRKNSFFKKKYGKGGRSNLKKGASSSKKCIQALLPENEALWGVATGGGDAAANF